MEEYLKQNVNRHKSEKMLDKFLYKSEKKECENLEKKLHHIEKINEVSLNRKKNRSGKGEESQKDPISKISQLKEKIKNLSNSKEDLNKTKISQIDIDYSIEKILKHISNKDKFPKCLKLLKDLLSSKIESLIPITIIKVFYFILYTIPFKFHEKDDRLQVEGLFDLVDKKCFDLFDSDEMKIWECFKIPVKIQAKLITDDSFTFSSIMKLLDNSYNELVNFDETENKLILLFEKMNSIKTIEESIEDKKEIIGEEDFSEVLREINILCNSLKRRFIFDCLNQVFPMHKSNWASVQINKIFKKVYLDKGKFNHYQNSKIENMINIMKNNNGLTNSIDNQRQLLDQKIKNNPLDSYYKVSDARTEVAVLGDDSRWEAKQSGLTASKMYINN